MTVFLVNLIPNLPMITSTIFGFIVLIIIISYGFSEDNIRYIEYDNEKFSFVQRSTNEMETYYFKDLKALKFRFLVNDICTIEDKEISFNSFHFNVGEIYLFKQKLEKVLLENRQ